MPSLAARRARLAAELEFAPQQNALLMLLQQARGERDSGIAASESAATGVARSARQAIRPTRAIYADAGAVADRAQGDLASQLAGLGSAADPYKASAATESGLADQLRSAEQARAVTELRQRGVEARQGAAYDARALTGQYQDSVLRIAQSMQQLAGQQGAKTQSLFMDLLDDAQDRRMDRAGLNETRRHNRVTEGISQQAENRQAREDARNGGRGWLPQSQQNTQFDLLDQAREAIREHLPQMVRAGGGSGVLRQGLARGFLLDGNGVKLELPKVPRDLINAAFDLERPEGALSWANVRALHRRGLRIGRRYPYERRGGGSATGRAISQGGRDFNGL